MNMGFCMIWGHEMMKRATWYGLLSPYQFVESAATCWLVASSWNKHPTISYVWCTLLQLSSIMMQRQPTTAW
jgi:hypothetical protein